MPESTSNSIQTDTSFFTPLKSFCNETAVSISSRSPNKIIPEKHSSFRCTPFAYCFCIIRTLLDSWHASRWWQQILKCLQWIMKTAIQPKCYVRFVYALLFFLQFGSSAMKFHERIRQTACCCKCIEYVLERAHYVNKYIWILSDW